MNGNVKIFLGQTQTGAQGSQDVSGTVHVMHGRECYIYESTPNADFLAIISECDQESQFTEASSHD